MKKHLIHLVSAACLVITTVTLVGVPTASADAGNPILGTITGDIVPDASGPGVTVFVRGEWNWLSHTTDCNFDRAATGVGIVWRDPQGSGYPVVKGSINEQVGVKTSNSGNVVDQMVHPVDRGNVPEGYTANTFQSTTQGYPTNAAGDYPSGQQFVDPAPPDVNSFANWKGGCGREPTSATASKTGGSTCANGTTNCATHPWGSWGNEKVDPQGHVGYSHHYNSRSDVSTVCANFYDVHGGGKFNSGKMQLPNGAKEITVNGNGDNSIQTNSFNTAQGANCVSFPNATPTLTTTATSATIGSAISDTAHISGLIAPIGGSITFKAYAPKTDGSADTACGTLLFTSASISVNANGDYGSGNFTPSGVAPQIVGTYEWTASYNGSGPNDPVATGCDDAGEQSVVNKKQPAISTTALTPVTLGNSISDSATISGLVSPSGGTITFNAYAPLANGSPDTTCATSVYTKVVTGISANGPYSSDTFTPSKPGVYEWVASFSGDGNNLPVTGHCDDTGEKSTVNKVQPSIVTSATASVTIGNSITDSATISGLVSPSGGTITFNAYAPLANGSADTTCTTSVYTKVVTGIAANGSYSPIPPFTPSTAGTYEWIASYSGDANNLPVTGHCDDTGEKSQVNPVTPTIVTSAAGPITLGGMISDTATISGLVNPSGGQLIFRAYAPKADGTADKSCTTVAFTSNAATVNANGQYTSSPLFQPSTAGVYEWKASYGGDGNNVAKDTLCDDAGEQSVVNKATPSITTQASGPVSLGGSISDNATISGLVNPTASGTITFRAYAPQANGSADATCSTLAFTSNAVTVNNGNGTYSSTPLFQPSTAGIYEWRAFYSGDANNNSVSTSCNEVNEQSTVNKASPSITTVAVSPRTIGQTIADSASIGGLSNGAGGTITFVAYAPLANGAPDTNCSTSVFTSVAFSVNGPGPYSSGNFTPTTIGVYEWRAFYSGDVNNAAVSTPCNDTNEQSQVNKAQPAIVTTASSTTIGGSISDSATISGLVSPSGGSITFNAYAPNADGTADTTCSNSVYTKVVSPISANGTVGSGNFTPTGVTPQIAGVYEWIASFSGDAKNEPVSGTCNATNEQSTVNKHPSSVPTGQKLRISDKAQVVPSDALGGTPTGTVTFQLFDNASCLSSPTPPNNKVYDSGPVTLSGGVATTPNPPTVSANGTYFWKVSYSGDNVFGPATGACGDEQVTTSGNTPGVDP